MAESSSILRWQGGVVDSPQKSEKERDEGKKTQWLSYLT